MIVGRDRPIGPRGNVFACEIVKVLERGASHTLFLRHGQDDYDFEISVPNLPYRNLGLKEGEEVTVAFEWNSLWVIPDG